MLNQRAMGANIPLFVLLLKKETENCVVEGRNGSKCLVSLTSVSTPTITSTPSTKTEHSLTRLVTSPYQAAYPTGQSKVKMFNSWPGVSHAWRLNCTPQTKPLLTLTRTDPMRHTTLQFVIQVRPPKNLFVQATSSLWNVSYPYIKSNLQLQKKRLSCFILLLNIFSNYILLSVNVHISYCYWTSFQIKFHCQ